MLEPLAGNQPEPEDARPAWQVPAIKTAKIVRPKCPLLMAPSLIRAAPFQET
jgi:hypothetical protein